MRLLEVKDLRTYFTTSKGKAKAVDGVSFSLDYGQCLGLVGESGCGKTTTALSICHLLPKEGKVESGQILMEGIDYGALSEEEIMKHRWEDVSIIFQGAMNAFNPVKKVGWQIAEACILHQGMSKEDAWKRAGDLFEMVGIARERVSQYPHEFSGGMKQRAMIAMALACSPKLIIGDEPTTALDVMIQAQILELLEKLRKELNMGMILITHDLSILSETCDKIAVMYAGKIAEMGTVDDIFNHPMHPYTKKLLACFPNISSGSRVIPEGIPGYPPSLIDPPEGCRFCPRCSESIGICSEKEPEYIQVGPEHFVSCHLCGEGGENHG